MEDIGKITEKIIESFESIIYKCDADVKAAFEALDKIVSGADQNSQKSKKKAKRLSVIADTDSEDSLISENDVSSRKPLRQPSVSVETSAENKDTRSSSRPVRAAKLRVENCLKEKPLNSKLRRPSGIETSLNEVRPKIKKEKASDASDENGKQQKNKEKNESKSISGAAKRKSSETDGDNSKGKDVEESSKKVDESLIIMNNNEPLTVEVSDDEVEKMPPPAVIPKKRHARRKQGSNENNSEVPRLNGVKVEKQSLESKSDKTEVTTNELATSKTDSIKVKTENISEEEKSSVSNDKTAHKGKKGRKQKHKPIKEEKIEDNNAGHDKNTKETQNSIHKNNTPESANIRQSARNKKTSIESIYEDAISEVANKNNTSNSNGKDTLNSAVLEAKETKKVNEVEIGSNLEKASDATFLSAVDTQSPKNTEIQSCNDQTFNAGQTTFVMTKGGNNDVTAPLDKKKCQLMPAANDATFRINSPSEGENQKENKITENSILTDDESEEESVPIPMRVQAKNKNELFNPFIQSPVKKKVEAFEKHANIINSSPSQQRQTRIKTRAQKTKENKEPSQMTTSKITTPNLVRNISRYLTPTQQTTITASFASGGLKKLTPNSSSKLVFPILTTKPQSACTSASLSRDSSTEDMKRGNRLQQLEDKKKKREQKQQMATQVREAKEKERAEKLKRVMEEREEKIRRKALEVEQKRQLEEINRNLKLQEEKREAQKRLEKQKHIEMAETARKERELLDAMKIQKAKQRLLQERKLFEQKKIAKKGKQLPYNFEMLNSDDSTDEEGKISSKRPAPPIWSKSTVRQLLIERQAHLPTKITDSFFSVQPMTPDLRKIFPTIDSRYLKRNSSVFWRTPPRYSQLPKY